MSKANLKIVFVKKQKQTRQRPTQGGGGAFIITEMAVFTLATDYLCEMGYPFDNSRQIGNTSYVLIWNGKGFNFEWTIRLTLSVNFDGQFEDGLSVSDSLCTAAPSPQKKIGEGVSFRGVCWGGGDCAQARLTSLKTANNEIPVSSVFNDSEGLYRNKTVCRCLVHRIGLIIPRSLSTGLWSSGELGRGKSEKASLPPLSLPFPCYFFPQTESLFTGYIPRV